jgi:hypothetical protein
MGAFQLLRRCIADTIMDMLSLGAQGRKAQHPLAPITILTQVGNNLHSERIHSSGKSYNKARELDLPVMREQEASEEFALSGL